MTLEEWRDSGKPYFLGIDIFRDHGGDPSLLSTFEKYRNGFVPEQFAKKLEIELESLFRNPPSAPQPAHNPISRPTEAIPSEEKQQSKDEPEEIANIRARIRKEYKTFSYLHSMLSTDISTQNRFKIARTIVQDVLPAIDQMYDDIRNWERTGKLPMEWDMRIVREVMKAVTRRRTVKQQIRRISNALEKEKDARKIKTMQSDLEDKNKELAYLSKKLGITWPPEKEQ